MSIDDSVPGLDIAVIGMSCAYPGAADAEQFWHNIMSGVESLTDLTETDLLTAGEDPDLIRTAEYVRRAACIDDVEMFDAAFFGLTPREAEKMDPQHRLFLEHCWRAVEAAGYDPRRLPGPVGVYAGQGANTYIEQVRSQVDRAALKRTGGRWESVGSLENDVDYLTPKISYYLDLTGPSLPVSTACSTSLVAVHLACQALRTFECDAALAGGVSISPPVRRGYLYLEGGIASADGHTRSFDARSTGTVFGSGVGVVLLKRLEDALADGDRIDGVIIGSAVNNDGGGRAGFTAPGVDGQAHLIAAAQAMAGAHPDTITYLEAHGTGTPIGDPIEIAALTRAFREQTERRGYCVLGSVKANIGHMDSAAGIAGLIKALHAVKHGIIPPQLNFHEPNPALRLAESPFRIATERERWVTPSGVPRRAGVSSFGIGGTNAHVIVQEPPTVDRTAPALRWQILPVSAREDAAVSEALTGLAERLDSGTVRLDDAAYTLHAGRSRFARRAAVVARDNAGAAAALRERRAYPFVEAQPTATVAFLFPGQGAHYPGMARGLYAELPEFTAVFDRCADLFTPLLGHDLRELVFGEDPDGLLDQTRFVQPALFTVEYALAQAMIARGVQPSGMLGHSMGEYVAATLSGVFTLEDAARVIDVRSRLMQSAPPGGMLAVPLPEAEVTPMLTGGLTIAADNGPRLVAVAGAQDELDELQRALAARDVTTRRLRVGHAAHSPSMADPAARLVEFMRTIAVQAPQIPYVSNVTGTWITEEQVRSPGYWGRHMLEAVRFRDGLNTLLDHVTGPLVEIGPGHGMLSLARAAAPTAPDSRFVRTARSKADEDDDIAVAYAAFAALWEHGVEPDWPSFDSGMQRRADLPTYPFQRKRFWIETTTGPQPVARQAPLVRDPNTWLYAPAWHSTTLPRVGSGPRDVIVVGGPDALTAAARAAGHRVTSVHAATADELRHALDHAVTMTDQATVVYADGLPAGPHDDAPVRLLAVARTLAAHPSGQFDLMVLTAGTFDVTGDETIVAEQAILAGIGKVIPKELPHVSCRVVDLDAARDAAGIADALTAELAVSTSDPVVAYRGPRRWAQGVERLPAA
ncbi:type I polyketide synthase, partial [Micromonospora sonneratiae]